MNPNIVLLGFVCICLCVLLEEHDLRKSKPATPTPGNSSSDQLSAELKVGQVLRHMDVLDTKDPIPLGSSYAVPKAVKQTAAKRLLAFSKLNRHSTKIDDMTVLEARPFVEQAIIEHGGRFYTGSQKYLRRMPPDTSGE